MIDVSIKLYELADAEDLQAAARESVNEVGRWMGWCHSHYSLDEARQWILAQQENVRQGSAHEFAIRSTAGDFLGGCGVNQVNKANRFANLGYWVRTTATRQGVAVAAAHQAADYAFAQTDLIRLEIVCAVANLYSQRVAEKLGAVREGVLRHRLVIPNGPTDAVMFSLVRNQ